MRVNEPIFKLERARVVIGATPVLEDVSFLMNPGEFVVLLGANGSGKTTLVKALLDLLPLRKGSLQLFGQPVSRFRNWGRIGYVPQRFTAASGVPASVEEVVLSGRVAAAGWIRPFARSDREAARRAVDLVGLGARLHDPVTTLSVGQQQRALIARALAGEPEVLVLDEPTAGLDVDTQASFAGTLGTLHDKGHSILLVAHGLGAFRPLADRAVVLQAGTTIYDGEPIDDYDHHVHHREEVR